MVKNLFKTVGDAISTHGQETPLIFSQSVILPPPIIVHEEAYTSPPNHSIHTELLTQLPSPVHFHSLSDTAPSKGASRHPPSGVKVPNVNLSSKTASPAS